MRNRDVNPKLPSGIFSSLKKYLISKKQFHEMKHLSVAEGEAVLLPSVFSHCFLWSALILV